MRLHNLFSAWMVALSACTGSMTTGADAGSGATAPQEPWPPLESPYPQVASGGASCSYSDKPVIPTHVYACDPNPGLACGASQRDCLGGPCVDGECQPCVLAYGPMKTYSHVAVDGRNAYFRSNGIKKVHLHGGPVVQIAAEDHYIVAEKDGFVYTVQGDDWGGHGLWRVSVDGGELSLITQLPAGTGGWILDGDTLYMHRQDNSGPHGCSNEVWSVDIHSGGATFLASGYQNLGLMTAGAGRIWGWNAQYPETAFFITPMSGGAPAKLPSPVDGTIADGLLFGGQLYFTVAGVYALGYPTSADYARGGIWRMWPDGSHAAEIARCQPIAGLLVMDDTVMYWNVDKHLMKLTPGGEPIAVYDTNKYFYALALDDEAVYWSDENALIKLAR